MRGAGEGLGAGAGRAGSGVSSSHSPVGFVPVEPRSQTTSAGQGLGVERAQKESEIRPARTSTEGKPLMRGEGRPPLQAQLRRSQAWVKGGPDHTWLVGQGGGQERDFRESLGWAVCVLSQEGRKQSGLGRGWLLCSGGDILYG